MRGPHLAGSASFALASCPQMCRLQAGMFHLLSTYTWFWKVQDVGSTRPPTDRALLHVHTTYLLTEA